MLGDYQFCIERARECQRLANCAPGPISKQMFAEMASAWRNFADKFDGPPVFVETAEELVGQDSNNSNHADGEHRDGLLSHEQHATSAK